MLSKKFTNNSQTADILSHQISLTNQSLVGKREKLLSKFKGRKGRFDSLPQWIQNFENEIRIEIEKVRSLVKVSAN